MIAASDRVRHKPSRAPLNRGHRAHAVVLGIDEIGFKSVPSMIHGAFEAAWCSRGWERAAILNLSAIRKMRLIAELARDHHPT